MRQLAATPGISQAGPGPVACPNPKPEAPTSKPPIRLLFRFVLALALMSGWSAPAQATSLASIRTLFLIVMENVSWPDVVGGTNAPYLRNVLLPQSAYCDNMFIVPGTFGSLPQYLWLESGTNWGVTVDSNEPVTHHFGTTNHLVIQLQNAGISWKAYQENISGAACPTANSGLYAAFHNPFVYFDDIYLNPSNCAYHIRPYSELARDLTNNTVARYNFITPNLCNDMHGGSGCPPGSRILVGDTWLANEIPKLMSSPAYRNEGAIIITWDEGTGNVAGPFGTIVLSQFATNLPPAGPGPEEWEWVNLLTNVLATNRHIFLDPNAVDAPRRFYRVLETR